MLDHEFDRTTLKIKVPASHRYSFELFGDELNEIALAHPPGKFRDIENIEIEWVERR